MKGFFWTFDKWKNPPYNTSYAKNAPALCENTLAALNEVKC